MYVSVCIVYFSVLRTHLRVGCICRACLCVYCVLFSIENPSSSGLYLPRILCFCVYCVFLGIENPSSSGLYVSALYVSVRIVYLLVLRTHLRVGCICRACLCVYCVLFGIENPSSSGLYLPRILCFCVYCVFLGIENPSSSGLYLPCMFLHVLCTSRY